MAENKNRMKQMGKDDGKGRKEVPANTPDEAMTKGGVKPRKVGLANQGKSGVKATEKRLKGA